MLSALFATVLIWGDPSSALSPGARATIGSSTHFVSKDPVELERQYRRSFELTDRNGDGYIDLAEAPMAERGHQNADGDRIAEEASNSLWVRLMDTGSDGRVDWPEMRAYLMPIGMRANGL